MEKLISIVIPVYNTEKYLYRCIQSIIKQIDFYESYIEILLIDDGSTDQSGKLCDHYSSMYNFITSFHKSNGGLSDTRNYGILNSQGKYLLFLDSDDRLNSQALSTIIPLLKYNSDTDVFIGRYCSTYGTSEQECTYHWGDLSTGFGGALLIKSILKNTEHYDWYAWLNIVKKEFIIENSLFFQRDRYFEDALWTPNLLYEATKVHFVEYPFYLYTRNRRDSISRTFSAKIYADKLYVCKYLEQFCAEKALDRELQILILGNLSLIYNSILADYWELPQIAKKKVWKDIIHFRYIHQYSKRRIEFILRVLEHLIGLKGVSLLLNLRKGFLRYRYEIFNQTIYNKKASHCEAS